jgi:sulfur carrier protein
MVMTVTVELAGESSHEVDAAGKTYADLLAPFDLSKHEVSLLVDGRPVPEDKQVEADVDHVEIVRLIQGG